MSKRVLVVEDNVIMREVMLTHLNNLKVNCYAVTTGEEAIDLAEYFDLILMDIDLPGINGVEAARQIREREEQNCLEPAVIVATTSGDNESECLAAGINEFQQKPLYRVDVKTIVERWLLSRPRKSDRWVDGALKIMNKQEYFQACRTTTPLRVLQKLAQASCLKIRIRVAENEACSPSLLVSLSRDKNAEIRAAVSANPSTPAEIQWNLASDEHPDVRYCLAENANTPLQILIWLCSDENPYIAHRASRTLRAIATERRTKLVA